PPLSVDSDAVPALQAGLQRRELLPATQLVDAGYVDAGTLVSSPAQYQVDLLGPALADTAWQARAGHGFAARDFALDWEAQHAVCPGGKQSIAWHEKEERGQPVVAIYFSRSDCRVCPLRSHCTRAAAGRRLTLRPEAEYRALQAAREREQRETFRALYA